MPAHMPTKKVGQMYDFFSYKYHLKNFFLLIIDFFVYCFYIYLIINKVSSRKIFVFFVIFPLYPLLKLRSFMLITPCKPACVRNHFSEKYYSMQPAKYDVAYLRHAVGRKTTFSTNISSLTGCLPKTFVLKMGIRLGIVCISLSTKVIG